MAAPVYIEQAVTAMLKASPAVSAACAKRVYPLQIPQGTTLPAVVYQRVHSRPDHTLQGYTSEAVLLMVNSFALTYTEAKNLALAVRAAMSAAPLHAILRNEMDLPDENGVTCVTAEYLIQQLGGFCHG